MKQSQFWKSCFNPKILIGLGIVVAILFIFFRDNINVSSALPFLFLLVCPLSMILIMVGMKNMKNNQCDVPEHKPATADVHNEKNTQL